MVIYSPLGIQILDAPVTKEAIIKYALMSDYYIQLPFNQLQYIQIPQGSYILYKGRKFEIMAPVYPEFDNKTGGYKYTLKFEAQQNHMKRFVCFWLGGDNPEAVFHNTTDLESFGALIVANMNKHLGVENWSVGTIDIENPKATKLVSFNGDKCWGILNTIAETFEVEWWTEENGDLVSLNFGKLERGTPEEFKRGDVVKSIPAKKGDDSSYGTRFYVFGSTRNLTSDYGQAPQGGETNHVSEIRLRLPNGQRYIDAIPNLDKSAIVEQVVFFDDIYPKNTETITSIETVDREIIEGQTDKAYVMYCKDSPFLPSDMIEGETLGATFTSGSLMGRNFELSINYKPETWKPEPGDTFVLTGVKLPQQRIEEAEEELLKAGKAYAAKNSSDTDVYTCETNPVYCTVNKKNYDAGQAVLLVDPRFGLNGRLSRIQGYEKKLYNEYIATYTIGDNTPYSRIGSIESDVKATLYSQRIGVTDSGAAIYLITRYDSTAAEDYNAYSAKRALWQFANKQFPDTFKGKMTFEDGAQFGDFATGITGIGGLIDKKGNAEMQSLKLRGFLEVPELRYNRVDITMGDTWFAPSAGIIESVDTEAKTITLKLEEGEIGSPRVGDICMGIFHSSESSDNATEDYDDSKGNRRFAGFATCYFRITEELDTTTYKTFKYQLRPVSAAYPKQYHPAPSMTFVGYGSFSNEARQTSRYETRTYQRYLKGVSDWEFISSNIAAQYGDLSNLSVFGIDMKGYSAYLNNIYMSGVIHQFTPGGEEIPTINDRGKWLASETYNKNDEVYHNNAKWRCLVDGTKSEPSTSSEAWVLLMQVPLSSVVPVYKQQNEKPALPTGSTVPPDGWSLEYPEGGDSGASTDVTNIIIDADNEGDVTQDGVFYKLAGKGNNSTVSCKIQFDALSAGATLVLDITAYSEEGYDKLAVGKINVQNVNTADSDTYEAEVSGNGVSTTVVVTAPSAGRHFVNVVYSKDSSGDANGDYGLFRIAYNTSKTIPLWVSFGSVIDGVVQSWSDPARISGADGRPGTDGRPGVDGTDYEWIFTRTTSETAPATPASQDEDDYLPDGWTDDAEGPDNTHPFEWTCKRSKVNGHWGDFSTPSLWAKYSFNGEDGIDGEGVEYIFTRTKTDDPSDIPDVPRVAEYDNPPAPWTDDPMGVDDIYQYEWVSKRIKVNGEWSAFSTPALWAKYSFDGTDGRPGDWTSYVFKKSIDKPGTPISTKPIPDGWEDAPSGDGIWWMSKATINGSTGQASALTWSDPIKVTGEDGQPGPYTDFKYASSSDDSIGPDIESNVREPDGWYDNPPALSSGEYLWMTKAQVDANDELVEPWSDPVRISGEQGKPGDKGDPGYQGCIIRLTEWVSGVEYRNDADLESDSLRYIDIVTVYENNRQLKFQCRQTHTSSNSNKPSGGTTSTYWQQLNDMVPIYTPLLFAENAVINFLQGMEFVVHNSKTDISENTIIAGLVGGDIPLFVGSNTPDNAPFRVAKDGSFTATKANIIGRIEATSGKIGNFTIDNDYWLQSSLSPSSGKDCSLFMSAARITLENIDDNYKNTFDVSAYPTSTMGAVNHSVLTVNTNRKSSQDINYYNIGIYISAEGSFGTNPLNPSTKCGNHALYLRKGDVCGLRLYNRKISSNVTLDDMDCFVTVDSDGGKRTITLPYKPQDGQLYYIRNIGTKGVQLNGNGKQIAIHTQGAWVNSDSWTDRESRNLIYCASIGCWVMFK